MGGCVPSCFLYPGGPLGCWSHRSGERHQAGCLRSPNSLYAPVPNGLTDKRGRPKHPESLAGDVRELMDAVTGVGTNTDKLIRVFGARTEEQMQAIAELFRNHPRNTDRVRLDEVIQSNCAGDFRDALLCKLRGHAEVDAQCIHDAVDGIGTDEQRLNEICSSRGPLQMEEIKRKYGQLYPGKTLEEDVKGDTSFSYKKSLMAMMDRADFIADVCYESIHGHLSDPTGLSSLGTDEEQLIRMLASISRDNSALRYELRHYDDHFGEGWKEEMQWIACMPDIQDVKAAYVRKYRCTLEKSIEGDTHFQPYFRKTLIFMLKDKAETGATTMHKALHKRPMCDKNNIIGVFATRTQPEIRQVAEKYRATYGCSLEDDLRENMLDGIGPGGSFNALMRDLCKDRYQHAAEYLHLAMKGNHDSIDSSKTDGAKSIFRVGMIGGLGTDEARLTRIIMNATKHDLVQIEKAYNAQFGRDLQDDIEDETYSDYENLLLYRFHHANSGMQWVPRHKLERLADIEDTCGVLRRVVADGVGLMTCVPCRRHTFRSAVLTGEPHVEGGGGDRARSETLGVSMPRPRTATLDNPIAEPSRARAPSEFGAAVEDDA